MGSKINIKTKYRYIVVALICAVVLTLAACASSLRDGAEMPQISAPRGNIYGQLVYNGYHSAQQPSYFAVYTNTASYTNFRRLVQRGYTIPPESVRTEEFINYFDYSYALPAEGQDAALSAAVMDNPWDSGSYILRVSLTARPAELGEVPSNLVFLVDVSGSMMAADRLELAKTALCTLVRTMAQGEQQLPQGSKVSLIAYAGESRQLLHGESDVKSITDAVESLSAGGMSYGQNGIQAAFDTAQNYYIEGGNNRIVMVTDGDFNVGIADRKLLKDYISRRRAQLSLEEMDIRLHTVGVGMGNLQDSNLRAIALSGGGEYSYIDSVAEAYRAFAAQASAFAGAFASNVKIGIQFDTQAVSRYKLLGYEQSMLTEQQWLSPSTDTGTLSYGHTVTALYQVETLTPPEQWLSFADFTLKYKELASGEDKQLTLAINHHNYSDTLSQDDIFTAAVAGTALALRQEIDSAYLSQALQILQGLKEQSPSYFDIYKTEFITLLQSVVR